MKVKKNNIYNKAPTPLHKHYIFTAKLTKQNRKGLQHMNLEVVVWNKVQHVVGSKRLRDLGPSLVIIGSPTTTHI